EEDRDRRRPERVQERVLEEPVGAWVAVDAEVVGEREALGALGLEAADREHPERQRGEQDQEERRQRGYDHAGTRQRGERERRPPRRERYFLTVLVQISWYVANFSASVGPV